MKNQDALVMTMTGEIFQPVRLYYKIRNMKMVLKKFGGMSCMNYDEANKRWTWLYEGDSRSLQFKNSYESIPENRRPIILGSFYTSGNMSMHLDVGSIERATTAVVFFDQKLGKSVAENTFCAIYNKILPEAELPGANFDSLFSEVKTNQIYAKQEAAVQRMLAMMKAGRMMEVLHENNFDLVEAFPTNFYPDGIELFKGALRMRQVVAMKRWSGDENYSLSDVICSSFHI